MLRKLIKYDLKYLNRFLLALHGYLIVSALAIRFFTPILLNPFISFILVFLFMMIATVLMTGTTVMAGIRFYQNLFSDEGYLTNTLPATSGQHLFSKTVSGSIWACINVLLTFICGFIVISAPLSRAMLDFTIDEMLQSAGFTGEYASISPAAIVIALLVFCLFGSIGNIVMIYASVALGQLFPSHHVLGAVIAYFVISFTESILSFISLVIFGSGALRSVFTFNPDAVNADFSTVGYVLEVLRITGGLMFVVTAVLYAVTYGIMKKKINLA